MRAMLIVADWLNAATAVTTMAPTAMATNNSTKVVPARRGRRLFDISLQSLPRDKGLHLALAGQLAGRPVQPHGNLFEFAGAVGSPQRGVGDRDGSGISHARLRALRIIGDSERGRDEPIGVDLLPSV